MNLLIGNRGTLPAAKQRKGTIGFTLVSVTLVHSVP